MSKENETPWVEQLWVARCECGEYGITDYDSPSGEDGAAEELAEKGWTYDEQTDSSVCPTCKSDTA